MIALATRFGQAATATGSTELLNGRWQMAGRLPAECHESSSLCSREQPRHPLRYSSNTSTRTRLAPPLSIASWSGSCRTTRRGMALRGTHGIAWHGTDRPHRVDRGGPSRGHAATSKCTAGPTASGLYWCCCGALSDSRCSSLRSRQPVCRREAAAAWTVPADRPRGDASRAFRHPHRVACRPSCLMDRPQHHKGEEAFEKANGQLLA